RGAASRGLPGPPGSAEQQDQAAAGQPPVCVGGGARTARDRLRHEQAEVAAQARAEGGRRRLLDLDRLAVDERPVAGVDGGEEGVSELPPRVLARRAPGELVP